MNVGTSKTSDETLKPVDNFDEFRSRYDHIILDQLAPEIEVSDSLYMRMCADRKSPNYFTWGNPAIRVYREGKRNEVKVREKLSPEEAYEADIADKRKALGI